MSFDPNKPVSLEEYNATLRGSVNDFYEHAMNDPTMSRDEAIKSTAEMSEKYIDAVQEFQESHEMQTSADVGTNEGVQSVESNGIQEETNALDATDVTAGDTGVVDSEYSSIDPANGNVIWDGPLSLEKGNHSGMPSRTDAYLPGDERGHVNASSLGGGNTTSNIVAQHHDLNHGGYLHVENGERNEMQNGAAIDSEKIAFVNGQTGDRPSAFIVNDTVTYADGHSETIHNSFTNESNTDQVVWNDMAMALPETYDAPNPVDSLRETMSSEEYADLMEETDATLLGIAADYAPSDFSGDPYASTENESDVSGDISEDSAIDGGIDDNGDGVDDGLDF